MNNLIRSNNNKFVRYWLKKYNFYLSLYDNHWKEVSKDMICRLYFLVFSLHNFLENKYGLFFHT